MMQNSPKTISLVIPTFNEEGSIPELLARLDKLQSEIQEPLEIIFVEDGGSDATFHLLQQAAEKNPSLKVIQLSRNFGHANAITAGIDHASGHAVVVMDGDLQDRPEAITQFIEKWKEGYDVVYAIRSSRQENSLMRGLFSIFYRINSALSGVEQPIGAGIFGLMDRRVVDVMKQYSERNRYLPGLRAYSGFKQIGIEVPRDARFSGAPRVGFTGLVKLAFDGFLSFSYVPLRLATLAGLTTAGACLIYIVRILYKKLVSGEAILGWASTLTVILFLGSLQLITLGIVGEYIARIYEEVKRRPYYIISKRINLD